MNHLRILTMALIVGASIVSAQAQVSNNNEDEVYKTANRSKVYDFVPGEVLVKFKDGSTAQVNRARGESVKAGFSGVDDLLQEFGVKDMEPVLPDEKPQKVRSRSRAFNGNEISDHDLSQLYRLRMKAPEVEKTVELSKRLSEQTEVEYAEPNYRAYIMGEETISSNPEQNPSYTLQWGIPQLKINELWTKPIKNETRPVIAILDTGVDTTHPDLKDNIWSKPGNENEHGYDFINETTDIHDYNAHGTHVAGIAAAVDNGEGIIGANPKALIMPVTVMQSDGTGDIATVIKGINYAAQNGATVINMSLGTYSNSKALRQALERAYQKCVLVAAAGNDFMRIHKSKCDHDCKYAPMFPAAYSFVLGVQATGNNGALASFSNHDLDGPNYSTEKDPYGEEGYNYELSAPGVSILSTVPNGGYKQFNGTSMAAPLVAGAISALQMVKQYDNQEILWGDLLHTSDFMAAFNVSNRPAELDVIGMQYNDRKELGEGETDSNELANDDGHIDAGETISLYPVLRTVFGAASNIKLHLEVGDNEDASLVNFTTNDVDFGFNLSPYGKNVSQNPIVFKTKGNITNGRHIKLKLTATCDNTAETMTHNFVITVDNMTKIGGMLSNNLTLTANKTYLVNTSLAIPEGITLTIEPGTVINFAKGTGISNSGTLIAEGTPGKMIVMQPADGVTPWLGVIGATLKYCYLSYIKIEEYDHPITQYENCILDNFEQSYIFRLQRAWSNNPGSGNAFSKVNLINSFSGVGWHAPMENSVMATNIVNCDGGARYDVTKGTGYPEYIPTSLDPSNNWIDSYQQGKYFFGKHSATPETVRLEEMAYYGTGKESLIRPHIYELGNSIYKGKETYAIFEIPNIKQTPNPEAHGIVWKVVVNGKDAQDEYEDLAPLGIGRHKFQVYYNRPMNKDVAPDISFGLREPYTQNAVNEDGAWNEDGTIYTAYATITKRTNSDGINRIYVYGGEDNEFFECPYEKTRFKINVQAANSMSTGFMAVGADDHVDLSWNTSGADGIEDAMGYNIYRIHKNYRYEDAIDEFGNKIWDDEADDWQKTEIIENDTIRINPYVIDVEATSYTDNAVQAGEGYYYYYKLQGTNLKEYGMSNVVWTTVGNTVKGDFDGNKKVDLNDVGIVVDFILGQKNGYQIADLDMNNDGKVDAADIVEVVKIIKQMK